MNSYVQFKILNHDSDGVYWFDYWFLSYEYITAKLMNEMKSQNNKSPKFFCMDVVNGMVVSSSLNPSCPGLYSGNNRPADAKILKKYIYVV